MRAVTSPPVHGNDGRVPRAVIVAVDDAPEDLGIVRRELVNRYGADYDVQVETSAESALRLLDDLRQRAVPVALVLASQWMVEMAGTTLLAHAHERHPTAGRGLLIRWGDRTVAEPILQAMALGEFDYYLPKPAASPDEAFHSVVESFLAGWARTQGRGYAPIVIVGDPASRRVHELRDLLTRNGLVHHVHSLTSPDGLRRLAKAEAPHAAGPVVFVLDQPPLIDPSNAAVAAALGVNTATLREGFDVVVIGAGPAGLGAGVTAASEGLRTLVIEGEALGGQAGTSSRIRNFVGFPTGVTGSELAIRAYEQAWLFGAAFHFMQPVTGLHVGHPRHTVVLSDGVEITTRAVVLASGVTYRRLGIPSLDTFIGSGVFYGATVSEAPAIKNRHVHVAGGGNSAGQAAVHLAKYASAVTILVRGAGVAQTMSQYLVTEIAAHPRIAVRTHTEIAGGAGDGHLESLDVRDTRTGTTETVASDALFVLIGAEPRTAWLPPEIERDEWGYIVTGTDLTDARRDPRRTLGGYSPMQYETSSPGIFAVGDVRHRSVKRVASAVGEGSTCISLVHAYLALASNADQPQPS